MRLISSALTIVVVGLALAACEQPCKKGYARHGVDCKRLPDAGSGDAGGDDSDGGSRADEGGVSEGDAGKAADGELCDGADNDGDGTKDEGFACLQSAAETACTTSCGSAGVGICTAQCQIPTAEACIAPVEQCDGIDQDCDGIADDGFSYSTLGYQVWTQTDFAADNLPDFAQVALLPRDSGGAWMMYRNPSAIGVFRLG